MLLRMTRDNKIEPRRLTAYERRTVLGLSQCDERTIIRWERGQRVRESSRARIEQALRRAGLAEVTE